MKTVNTIVKVITALAAVAGAVYIIATFGDKLVAWAKSTISKCPVVLVEEEAPVAPAVESEEAPEATPAEEPASTVPVADESDFEG